MRREVRWSTTLAARLLGCLVLAGCGKTGGDASETCESRVESYEGYTEPISPSDACEATRFADGPSGYAWCLWDGPESDTGWVDDPSPDGARATLASSAMQAFLTDDGRAISLSGYDALVLEADVPAGERFEIWLGHGADETGYGCSYSVIGQGDTTYRIPLAEPTWCNGSSCDHELWASGVAIGAWIVEDGDVELAVESLSLETTDGGVGRVSAFDGEIGPGGACWFLWKSFEEEGAEWVEPASCRSVHAVLTNEGDRYPDLFMELPDQPVDLTRFRFLEFEAIVNADPDYFYVILSRLDGTAGCSVDAYAEPGRVTYEVDLSELAECWDGSSFDLAESGQVGFGAAGPGPSTLDIEVFAVRFVE